MKRTEIGYRNSEDGAVVAVCWVEGQGKIRWKGILGRGNSINKNEEGHLRRPLLVTPRDPP